METKEVGFSKKFDIVIKIVEWIKSLVINTEIEFSKAEQTLKTIRELEKELAAEYAAHPVIVEAKRLQGIKGDIAALLENARKGLKNGAMLRYELAAEKKRLAEEQRLNKIAQEAAAKENARILADQKEEFDRLERERKAAKKKGDENAAAQAAASAAAIKAQVVELKANPIVAATVVIEKSTPSVPRRSIPKWRIKDASKIPCLYHANNDTKISGVVRSLRENHGIPGIEYYEELV